MLTFERVQQASRDMRDSTPNPWEFFEERGLSEEVVKAQGMAIMSEEINSIPSAYLAGLALGMWIVEHKEEYAA